MDHAGRKSSCTSRRRSKSEMRNCTFFKRVDEHVDEWVDQEESQKQNRRQQVQPCFKAFLFHNNIAPLVCVLKTDPFAGFLFKQEYFCRL